VIVYVNKAEKNDKKDSNSRAGPSSATSAQRMSTAERFVYPTGGFTTGGEFITDEKFTVYKGQNLAQIASKYNIPLSELLSGNPNVDPTAELTFGQVVWIQTEGSQGYQFSSDPGPSEFSIASDPGAVRIIPVKSLASKRVAKPTLTLSTYGAYQAAAGGIQQSTDGFKTGGEFKGKKKKGSSKWPTLGILTTGAEFKKKRERSATTDDPEFSILSNQHPEDMKDKPKRGKDTLITREATMMPLPYSPTKQHSGSTPLPAWVAKRSMDEQNLRYSPTKQTLHSGSTPLPAWVAKRSMDAKQTIYSSSRTLPAWVAKRSMVEHILKTKCEDKSPIGRYTCILSSLLNAITASQAQKLLSPITETILTMETLLINGLTEISNANGWNEMPDRVLDMRYERVLVIVQDAMQGLKVLLEKKAAALDWRGIETAISDLEAGQPFQSKEIIGMSSTSVGFLNVAINEAIAKLEELGKWQSELEDVIRKRFALMNEWMGDCFERRKLDALSGRYAQKRASKVAKDAKEWVETSNRREDCEIREVQKLLDNMKLVVGWLKGEEGKVAAVYKLTRQKDKKKYTKKNLDVEKEVEGLWELHRAVRGEFGAGQAVKEMVDSWKIAEEGPCKFRHREPVCGNV
jgi:hypothetical protein